MKYVLNSAQMKACDNGTITFYGVPSLVLMERAALAVVEEVEKIITKEDTVLIVCGSGNNGGDGIAIGRLMHLKGYSVYISFVGNEEHASEETKKQMQIARNYDVPCGTELPETAFSVVIDSIFGIGLCREVKGKYASVIARMNDMSGLKVAVDIASGINADTGQMMGAAFKADITVTFAFAKVGHLMYPGAAYTGALSIKEIGIDAHGFLGNYPKVHMLDDLELETLPERPEDGNKGTFGKALIIAGSINMAGAACFSARAAYRTGAGLVRVLTHEANRTIVQSLIPEAIITTYSQEESDFRQIQDGIQWATAIVIGPGLGQSAFAKKLVEYVLANAKVPCVIDADALNIIAKERHLLENLPKEVILTPHVGEMSRLTRKDIPYIKENPILSASELASIVQGTVILKDARTVISSSEGDIYINCAGNSGMATGGSGDVLTGIIAGLLCQGCSVAQSAYTGVYLHGLAGDRMSEELGKRSLIASDIIDGICKILKEGS